MDTGPDPSAAGSGREGATPVQRLARLWLGWFGAYLVLGVYAQANGTTSFLAAAVDHVEPLWIAILFLNLPLQTVLALVAIQCDRTRRTAVRRTGTAIAIVNTVLILVHAILAVVVNAGFG